MRRLCGLARMLLSEHRLRLVLGFVLALGECLMSVFSLSAAITAANASPDGRFVALSDLSLGDTLLWKHLGTPWPILDITWLVPFVIVLVIALPSTNITRSEEQALIRGGSRARWWLACCVESWVRVLVIWALMGALLVVGVALFGGKLTLATHSIDTLVSWHINADIIRSSDVALFYLLMFVGLLCLATLQLVLTRLAGSVVAFLVSVALLTVNCTFGGFSLPGSWFMTMRVAPFVEGLSMSAGFVVLLLATLVLVLSGLALNRVESRTVGGLLP